MKAKEIADLVASHAKLVEGLQRAQAMIMERDDKIRTMALESTVTSANIEEMRGKFQMLENEKDVLAYQKSALDAEVADPRVRADERITLMAVLKEMTRS